MKKIKVQITLFLAAIMALAFLSACGGVASNPTTPNFTAPGGTQPGTVPGMEGMGLPGQLSGGGAQMGEQLIQGNFEELWPQGLDALERSQIVTAAQFFMSAFHTNPQSADAAMAYAITDIMRDHRMCAIFMHPGIDKLMMNTPLVGMPEVFPNPFLTEDSYFLRLAAAGYREHSLSPNTSYPILAPVDTEIVFNPITLGALMGGPATHAPTPVPGQPVDAGGGEPAPGTPGGPHPPPPTPVPPGGTPPDETSPDGNNGNMGIDKIDFQPAKQGQAGLAGAGNTNEGQGAGTPGRTPPGGSGGFPAGLGTPSGQGQVLPERDTPLSEDEWETLIREYREGSARDGADILLVAHFYDNLSLFHDGIKEHIENLESVRTIVEAEGYSLALPFCILDGTQKTTLMFTVTDYNLILDHYKMIDHLLTYIECYNHETELVMPTAAIEDANGDMVLGPDDYLPAAPFGTLTEEGGDTLGDLLPEFINNLSQTYIHMEPLLAAAQQVQAGDVPKKELFYLSSFQRNFQLISEWTQLLRDISEKSTSGMLIKLASGSGVVEAVAIYDSLFKNPIEDIRTPLPSYDYETGAIITDDEGMWSGDDTFGGLLRDGLTTPDIFLNRNRFRAVIYSAEMSKAAHFSMVLGSSDGEANDKGIVAIDGALINELAGTRFTVSDASGVEAGTGSIRTVYEVIPLFDITKLRILYAPPTSGGSGGFVTNVEGAGETTTDGAGMTGTSHMTTGPSDESGEGEETEDEEGKEEESGDQTGGTDETGTAG